MNHQIQFFLKPQSESTKPNDKTRKTKQDLRFFVGSEVPNWILMKRYKDCNNCKYKVQAEVVIGTYFTCMYVIWILCLTSKMG